jgi:hypothetical protein
MGSRVVTPYFLNLDGGEWLFACAICKHNTAETIIISSEEVISSSREMDEAVARDMSGK